MLVYPCTLKIESVVIDNFELKRDLHAANKIPLGDETKAATIRLINKCGHGISYNLIEEIETEFALKVINEQTLNRLSQTNIINPTFRPSHFSGSRQY